MLLGALAASALRNMIAGKPKIPGQGVIQAGEGAIATSQGQGTIRVGQDF